MVLLCAGELMTAQAAGVIRAGMPELVVRANSAGLVPNVFAPAGNRFWRADHLPTWADLVLAPQLADAEPSACLAGLAAPPNSQATDWLREVVHRRERARGTASPAMPERLLEAICLAWAGEHDAALARVLDLVLSARNDDRIRAIVARVAMATALAIRRPDEAVQALETWWSLSPSDEVRRWARLVAAIAPTRICSMAGILESEPSGGAADTWDGEPWIDRVLSASWNAAAADAERMARNFIAIAATRRTPASAEDMMGLWRTWRGTVLPLTELVAAWPEVDRPGLRVLLEQGWQLEPPEVWDRLARAYCEVLEPTGQIVANAAELADLLPIESVIYWETTRQKVRVGGNSLLLQRARSERLSPVDAVFSASIAIAAGLGGSAEMAAAAQRLSISDIPRAVALVKDVSPNALPRLIQALDAGPLDSDLIADSIADLSLDLAGFRSRR